MGVYRVKTESASVPQCYYTAMQRHGTLILTDAGTFTERLQLLTRQPFAGSVDKHGLVKVHQPLCGRVEAPRRAAELVQRAVKNREGVSRS